MRLPSTTEMVTALKSKDKEQIKVATQNLKQAGEKYFASVPFPEVERMVAKAMLQTYANYIPAEQRINIFEIINSRFKGNIDAFVDACFEYSIFGNPKNFDKFIKKPSLYKIGHDWMILFKYSITDGILKTAIAMKEANQNYDAAHKVWVKGMMDMRQEKGTPIYPDANSTLRVAYGKIAGYHATDAVYYTHYTTLKGIMEKDNPNIYDYDVPQKLRDLYKNRDFGPYTQDGEVPVCFIATNHTTGGNSGSPVLDAEGNLIGLNFDRAWEGVMSDMQYSPEICRNIAVDIRYVLFIIDKYAGAQRLIDEMVIIH